MNLAMILTGAKRPAPDAPRARAADEKPDVASEVRRVARDVLAAAAALEERLDAEDRAAADECSWDIVPGCPARPAQRDCGWRPPCAVFRDAVESRKRR